ncbi:MAG: hypothetical protein AB1486_01470 [Planctomycetota bacterium]
MSARKSLVTQGAAIVLAMGLAATVTLALGGREEWLLTCVIGVATLGTLPALLTQVRWLDPLAPHVALPVVVFAYYGLGSLNVTTYRGFVEGRIFAVVLLGLGAFALGCLAARLACLVIGAAVGETRVAECRWESGRVFPVALLLMAVGAAAVVAACARYGVPLLDIRQRFEVSAYFNYFAELTWIGALLLFLHNLDARCLSRAVMGAIVLGVAILVAVLGYRTPVAVFGAAATVCLFYKRRPSYRTLAFAALALVAVMSLFWWVRLNVLREGGRRSTIEMLASRYQAPEWLRPFFTLYMTCREGTALFSHIVERAPEEGLLDGKLLAADLLTILPGEQESGGYLVVELMGGTGLAGLTPSILGGLYLDFGRRGVAVGMALFGLVTSLVYRIYRTRPTNGRLAVHAVFLSCALHYVHRGVFAPAYLFDLAVVVLAVWVVGGRSTGERATVRSRTRCGTPCRP